MKSNIVFYHGNCTDGLGAAYAAWKYLGNSSDYIPMHFKNNLDFSELPNVKDKNVYILDFSFSVDIYKQLLDTAKSVVLLDHHATAKKLLENLPGTFFDLSRSGAMIAWNYFHKDKPIPEFIKYIQDGDLFTNLLKETKPFYRSIQLTPKTFESFSLLEDESYLANVVSKGYLLEDFFQSQIVEIKTNAIPIEILGFKGVMINAPGMFASEIGHQLALEYGTYCLIWVECNDTIKCSLRSTKEFDSTLISLYYNGGGHPQASSFNLNSLSQLESIIKKI